MAVMVAAATRAVVGGGGDEIVDVFVVRIIDCYGESVTRTQ